MELDKVTPRRPSEVIVCLPPELCRSAHYWNAIKLQGVGGTLKMNHRMFMKKKKKEDKALWVSWNFHQSLGRCFKGKSCAQWKHHIIFSPNYAFFGGYRMQTRLTQTWSCLAMQALKRESWELDTALSNLPPITGCTILQAICVAWARHWIFVNPL